MKSAQQSHTISVLVDNKFGVLARIAGLFSGRGYNIASLSVSPTENPDVSRMIVVTTGDEAILEQIDKQLRKLIDVIRVDDLSGGNFIEREIALFKIKAETPEKKNQIIQLVQIFGGTFVSVRPDALGVELSGRSDQLTNFMEMVRDFGILEMTRSGRVAISRD